MTNYQPSLSLRFFQPNGTEKEITLESKLSIGSDKKNDLQLQDPTIEDFHCILRLKEGVVAIHNLARNSASTKIDSFELGQGKMYLLNPGDRVSLGVYQILIPAAQVAPQLKEQTSPSIPLTLDEDQLDIELDVTAEREIPSIEIDDEEIEIEEDSLPEDELPALPEVEQAEHSGETLDDISLSGLIVREDLLAETEDEYEEDEEEFSDTDQRILDAIQEGRQPDFEGTRTTFVTRLLRLSRIFQREKEKKNSQLFQRMGLPAPSPFLRIYSFFATIPLSFFTAYTLFPLLNVSHALKDGLMPIAEIVQETLKLDGNYLTTVHECLYFIATAWIVDLFSHLVLGTNLPNFFMGIKTNDGELAKRGKGFLRSLLSGLTLPFLVFDIPALFGKATFKEWILRSKMGIEGNRLLRFFAIFIIVPVLMVCCFYLPFTIDPDNVAGVAVERRTLPPLKNIELKQSTLSIPSLLFKFTGELPADLEYLPFFKIEEMKLNPTIMLFTPKDEQLVSFNMHRKVDFMHYIELAKNNDPLFLAKYPGLSSITQDPDWNELQIEELANLLEASFSLTPENFHDQALEYGPFITGRLLLRRELLQQFGIWENVNASIIKGKNQLILEVKDSAPSRFNNYYYLPLKSKRSTIYKLNFAQNSKKLATQVERTLVFAADYGSMDKVKPEEMSSHPVFILNLFNQIEMMKSAEVQKLIMNLYQQWNSKGKEDLTKKSIQSLIKAIKSKYKSDEASFSSFIQSLEKMSEEMQSTHQEKNRSENETNKD